MTNKYDADTDKALLNSVVKSLDESIEHLDAHTLSRLNQARHQALSARARPRLFNASWLTAGAFSVIFVSFFTGWLLLSSSGTTQISTDELELITASEDYELMQDLDFVAWMIEQEHAS